MLIIISIKKVLHRWPAAMAFLVLILVPGHLIAQDQAGASLVQFRIKLELHANALLKDIAKKKGGSGLLITKEEGLEDIDALNQAYKASDLQRLFPHAGKYEPRHVEYGLDRWYTVSLKDPIKDSGRMHEMIAAYGANRNIEIAEPVYEKVLIEPLDEQVPYEKQASLHPGEVNDPYFPDQWNLDNTGQNEGIAGADIRMKEAWKINTGDPGVVLAVIDGGIDVRHEDLTRSVWVNEAELNGLPGIDDDRNGYVDDVNGYSFVSDNGKIAPHFHGIHVAGILAGAINNGKGIAGIAGGDGDHPGIKLMSCAVFNMTGSGGFENAFVYAADNGAVIAQNSWGYRSENTYEQSVLDAINYFIDNAGYDTEGKPIGPIQGGLVVFAAGNSNSAGLYYPGCYEPVVAVGSTDNRDQRSYFSNYGEWLDIFAPGSRILSTYNYDTYACLSGTSMACPHVSGVASLLASQHKSRLLHVNAIKDILFTTCSNIDIENPDYRDLLGHGRLNAFAGLMLGDTILPSRISDLTIRNTHPSRLDLTWTATGSDSVSGSASYYEILYDTRAFDPEDFSSALLYKQHIKPAPAGETEYLSLERLSPGTGYWIAVKAFDMMGNSPGISNIIHAKTPAIPPETVKPDSLLFVASKDEIQTQTFTIHNHGSTELAYEISYEGQQSPAQRDENGRLFALGDNSNLIYELNPLNGEILNSYPAPEATADGKVGLAFDGSRVLFTNGFRSRRIFKINTETGFISDTIDVPGLPGIYGLGASRDRIYASYLAPDNNILEIDPAEKEIIRTFDIGQNSGFGLTYAGERGSLFVTNGYSDILEVDIASGTTVNQFTPSGPAYAAGYSNSLDLLFIGIKRDINNHSRIEAIDPETGQLIRSFLTENTNALAADEASYGGWLHVHPESGTIGIGDSARVNVEIQTSGLAADNYFRYLHMGTSNPFEPQIYLPVFLHVNGEAEISTEPGQLDFGNTYIGYSKCRELEILNTGTDSLHIKDIYASGDLYISDTALAGRTLYKNDSVRLRVYFYPQNTGLQTDTLYILTNAARTELLRIPLSGTGIVPPRVSFSVDTLMVSLDYMQRDSMEFAVGNHSGGSHLQASLSVEAPFLYAFHDYIGSANSGQQAAGRFLLGDLSGLNIAVAYSLSSISTLALDLERRGANIDELDVPLKNDLLLDKYDVIIIGSLIPHFREADLEKIRDWNKRGGGLWIINSLSGMDGPVNQLLQQTGLWAYDNLSYERITDLNTGHYTARQVDTLKGLNYQAAYSLYGLSQAVVIGRDVAGLVRLAASRSGEGRVFVTGAGCLYNSISDHTDTRLLLNRVVDWLGNRSPDWLAVKWQETVLAPGSDSLNEVTFNPEHLTESTYRANLLIRSNDPAQAETLVPCIMRLNGDAEILTGTDSIHFDTTFTAYSSERDMLISNPGTGILHIDSVVCSTGEFRMEPTALQVDPGKSVRESVFFEPETSGEYTGVISIFSNARINNPARIFCEAHAEQSPGIEMDVGAIMDTVFTHDTLHYQLTLGNRPHSSRLTFNIYRKKYYPPPEPDRNHLQKASESSFSVWGQGTRRNPVSFPTPVWRDKRASADPGKEDADVLLLHDDISDLSEIQGYLDQYPELHVSTFDADSAIPELSYLLQFSAVMVGNEGYWNNSPELGNVLADYADMDGGLILTVPAFHQSAFGLSGRLLQEGYMPFTTGISRLGHGEMVIKDQAHPLLENAGTVAVDNVLKDISFKEDAGFIAALEMGIPFIGTRRNVVGMNLYIGSPGSWSGDIPLIQRNAVHWLSDVPFLGVDVSRGGIESGAEARIDLTIDGSKTKAGDSLAASLIILTNDPARRLIKVPVCIYFDHPSPQLRKPIPDDTLYLEGPSILIVCDSVFADISGNGLVYSADVTQALVAGITLVNDDSLLIAPLAVGATGIILTATDTVFGKQASVTFNLQVVDTIIHGHIDLMGAVSRLLSCYPNPAQDRLIIKYSVAHTADVELAIYNALGIRKKLQFTERTVPGVFSQTFDISGLPPGVYIVKIKIGETRLQQKVMISH